jgi:hypothetical protein
VTCGVWQRIVIQAENRREVGGRDSDATARLQHAEALLDHQTGVRLTDVLDLVLGEDVVE